MARPCKLLVLHALVLVSVVVVSIPSIDAWLLSSPPHVWGQHERHVTTRNRDINRSGTCVTNWAETSLGGCSKRTVGRQAQIMSSIETSASVNDEISRTMSLAPVVLVGSDSGVLQELAAHVASDPHAVVDLGEVGKASGSRGVENALGKGSAGDVFVCPPTICLNHPEVRELVKSQPLTVHIAPLPEDNEEAEDKDVRKRCEQATKYTVVMTNSEGDSALDLSVTKSDLSNLVGFARKPRPSPEDVRLDMGKDTFFLSLTFKDFGPHTVLLPELTEGVDAMELRVDLLGNHNPYSVLQQLSILRRHTGRMPVVFTVRSKGQCGAFPDDPDALFKLAHWGLRAGAEVLDIEANWPMPYREALIREARENYPGTVLVGSYHVVGRKTTQEEARELFKECYHDGAVDAVKVVTTATEPEDSFRVHAAAMSLELPVPYIGLCLTPTGKLSRVLNSRFTPVTHERLPSVAAPGQMTSAEIMRYRAELGVTPPQSFFLFGHPISASPSPNMHNAGFSYCGLPHTYSLSEGKDPALMAKVLSQGGFGGASVTIPHKENVVQYLDEVSPAAQAIGAVNTVVVAADPATGARRLWGDNTDWLGILRPVRARLEDSGRSGLDTAVPVAG
ncbi:unnamed protein product, partial [Discosporangium mesarthrocarpum]